MTSCIVLSSLCFIYFLCLSKVTPYFILLKLLVHGHKIKLFSKLCCRVLRLQPKNKQISTNRNRKIIKKLLIFKVRRTKKKKKNYIYCIFQELQRALAIKINRLMIVLLSNKKSQTKQGKRKTAANQIPSDACHKRIMSAKETNKPKIKKEFLEHLLII